MCGVCATGPAWLRTRTPPTRRGPVDGAWRAANIGRLLTNALRHFEARVLQLLAEAGHHEVTASHINATRHLDLEGSRLTDMARRAAMTKQSMSELVKQLQDKGLVGCEPDPSDGRAKLVHFTPRGLEWLRDFGVAVRKAEAEMAHAIGAEALQQVKAALGRYGPPRDD